MFQECSIVAGSPLWVTIFPNPQKAKDLDKSLILFDLKRNSVITELHNVVRASIKKSVKSPFSIVNTRVWISKPRSADFGPNAPHKDGFYPRTMKTIVYLTPLPEEFGEFWVENTTYAGKSLDFAFVLKVQILTLRQSGTNVSTQLC
jgi:hypothetical protein